jgi:hypothetical protein
VNITSPERDSAHPSQTAKATAAILVFEEFGICWFPNWLSKVDASTAI